MKRKTRDRVLTDAEAAKYRAIREEVAAELPEIAERHYERSAAVKRKAHAVTSVSVTYAGDGRSVRPNAMGMRPMQERVWQHRGEQYLLIKSPPASGKSRALMFVALDKLHRQGLKQAIVVVPEKSIGASFADTQLKRFGFFEDWIVAPHWNLCNAPGTDGGKVDAVGKFLESGDKVLVCTHATFRFAFEKFGVEAFDDRLLAVAGNDMSFKDAFAISDDILKEAVEGINLADFAPPSEDLSVEPVPLKFVS